MHDLSEAIAAQPSQDLAVETLLVGIADRIKATSNDQNIQRLAQALRLETPAIVATIIAKRSA